MHSTVSVFVQTILSESEVRGKRILEVGSYNVNGSIRRSIVAHGPSWYHGVDTKPQADYVDEVLSAHNLVRRFGPEAFDVVVCLEVLEHVEDWQSVVRNLKGVLRLQGLLVLTCRSPGFPRHDYPTDYWRFTREDIRRIFSEFEIEHLLDDPEPGVLLASRKRAKEEVEISAVRVSAIRE